VISLTGIAVRETARLIISPGRVIDYLRTISFSY